MFIAILEYFYEGKVTLDVALLQPLMMAASRLQAMNLLDTCVQTAKGMLTAENCEAALQLADAVTRPDLAKAALTFIACQAMPTRIARMPPPSRPGESLTFESIGFIVRMMRDHMEDPGIVLSGARLLQETLFAQHVLMPSIWRATGAVETLLGCVALHSARDASHVHACLTPTQACLLTLQIALEWLDGGKQLLLEADAHKEVLTCAKHICAALQSPAQTKRWKQSFMETLALGGRFK